MPFAATWMDLEIILLSETILMSDFLGKFAAQVSKKHRGKAIISYVVYFQKEPHSDQDCIKPPPWMYTSCLHLSLETHPQALPFIEGFPSCFCRSAEDVSRAHSCGHWEISLFFSPWNPGWCFSFLFFQLHLMFLFVRLCRNEWMPEICKDVLLLFEGFLQDGKIFIFMKSISNLLPQAKFFCFVLLYFFF